jgi:hypothetical protein
MKMAQLYETGHNFGSGLAWEKESKEGNAFRGLGRGAGDRGRRMAVRRGMVAMGRGEKKGKQASEDAYLHVEFRQRAGATERRRSGETAASPSLAAKVAARLGLRGRGLAAG